jgi:phosphatidate cytidylyltransferase
MALSNNSVRIIVGIVTIPIILLISYAGNIYFLLFVLAIGLISFYEFSLLMKKKGISANLAVGFAAVAVIIFNFYRNVIDLYSFILLFLLILTLIELFRNKGSAILNVGGTLLGIFYVGFFSSAILALREFYPQIDGLYERGGFLIISIFAAIWFCDSAAYWGGTALGKHRLYARVSPKKSWEGAIFGFVFAIIAMILAKLFFLDFLTYTHVIIIGIIIGTLGQAGDLIESLFKRDADVKDSSAIIPGHGGIFDRFDSLLYVAPVIYIYLTFVHN